MAREDFLETEERLKEFGIVRICEDVYMKPNNRLFVKSPSGTDRTWSFILAILAECEVFQATQAEIREIQEQYAFGICHRSPGKDRGVNYGDGRKWRN